MEGNLELPLLIWYYLVEAILLMTWGIYKIFFKVQSKVEVPFKAKGMQRMTG